MNSSDRIRMLELDPMTSSALGAVCVVLAPFPSFPRIEEISVTQLWAQKKVCDNLPMGPSGPKSSSLTLSTSTR